MTASTFRHRPYEVSAKAREAGAIAFVQGTPVARGTHIGVARLQACDIQPGDVLICASPSPHVLTAPLGAIVADAGGVLSSAAITARERGIPAVFATRDGTNRIRDGQRIAVDGARGVVTILD